ncbi:MAG: adenylosuccinate lyase, partial [Tepidisphaeraceae bacterium]
LDDSSNKRLTIPEAFLAIDACMLIVIDVARGMVIYPKVIEKSVAQELPFMATEEILMCGVRCGGDRQHLHELIRRHSQAAAEQVKQHGRDNDLIDRLRAEPALAKIDFAGTLDPRKFIGRAPQQVDTFIEQCVEPLRRRYADALTEQVKLRV